jgi:hypothetical protein
MADLAREMKDLLKVLEGRDPPPADQVLERIKTGLAAGGRARNPAAKALVAVAEELDGPEVMDEVQDLLTDDKDTYQKLGLQVVSRLRRPPPSLVEPVADASYLPDARRALLRFDKDRVKRELKSLIGSQNQDERTCGLEIARRYGPEASEFAPQIASVLANDTRVQSAIAAVNALARMLPEDQLAKALEPAQDHNDAAVRQLAQRFLAAAGAPVRESIWAGHPFSDSLLARLQSMGFKPKGDSMKVPDDRPAPIERTLQNALEGETLAPFQLSPAVWAWLNMLEFPDYRLYTVWDSHEGTDTFHFSDEDPIFGLTIRDTRHLMNVIGDGSIGYFAAIDLRDTSNDPAVYYLERWYPEGWKVSWTLSSYLRNLGTRS